MWLTHRGAYGIALFDNLELGFQVEGQRHKVGYVVGATCVFENIRIFFGSG